MFSVSLSIIKRYFNKASLLILRWKVSRRLFSSNRKRHVHLDDPPAHEQVDKQYARQDRHGSKTLISNKTIP